MTHLAARILSMETVSGVVVPEFGGVRSTNDQWTINSLPGMITAAGI